MASSDEPLELQKIFLSSIEMKLAKFLGKVKKINEYLHFIAPCGQKKTIHQKLIAIFCKLYDIKGMKLRILNVIRPIFQFYGLQMSDPFPLRLKQQHST